MDPSENATGNRPRLVTVNQVVAWNVGWYRRQAGMTQRQLEERLGWKKGRASEAELSWNSGRTREFDAQLLADLAAVLGIPVGGLLIPPEGEDGECRYPAPGGKGTRPMEALIGDVILGGEDDMSDMLEVYRQRMELSASRYLDPDWARRVGKLLRTEVDPGVRADLAARLMGRSQQLLDASADFAQVAEALNLFDGGEDDQ